METYMKTHTKEAASEAPREEACNNYERVKSELERVKAERDKLLDSRSRLLALREQDAYNYARLETKFLNIYNSDENVRAERDELLAALKAVSIRDFTHQSPPDYGISAKTMAKVRSAIAKAERRSE